MSLLVWYESEGTNEQPQCSHGNIANLQNIVDSDRCIDRVTLEYNRFRDRRTPRPLRNCPHMLVVDPTTLGGDSIMKRKRTSQKGARNTWNETYRH
jgi:hypothetical protein